MDQLLSPSSKKHIKQILDSYGKIAATPKGIPRGVGISAYLAEFYLRPIDRDIRAIPGLVLYCRFVDDIIAIFARPPAGQTLDSFKSLIIEILAKYGLPHNEVKTRELKLASPGKKKFEYLGFRFVLEEGHCDIWASAAKIRKYKTRMIAAFDDYRRRSSVDSRGAYRDLVARIKFLTGNTRLSNSKSRAVTGVYYNNSIVTNPSSFRLLDKLLKIRVKSIRRPSLRKRLKEYSFTEGFITRRFHNFSAEELQSIVKVWKHG